MIYLQLFISFLRVGLFSIGGGYAALPLIQERVVDYYHWLTLSEFSDLITIAEMTPGPMAINSATFVGMKMAGILGSVISTVAVICPSLIICTILFFIYNEYSKLDSLQSILNVLKALITALIFSAFISIFKNAIFTNNNIDFIILILFIIATILIKFFNFKPILMIFSCGIVYLLINII